jgi:hypothetical protein
MIDIIGVIVLMFATSITNVIDAIAKVISGDRKNRHN